ncbi:MAG: hypothetical protein R3B06_04070 [Kofleriaceae bacterium]
MRMIVIALALVTVASCGKPDRTVRRRVAENSWETLKPTDVQVRLGPPGDAMLALAQGGEVKARGPAAVGSAIPITVDDVACAVTVDAPFEDASTDYRPSLSVEPGAPKPMPRDLQTQTWHGFIVTLACGAEPVPGSDASLRGARSLPSLPWGLPALVLGFICGLYARPDRLDGARMSRAGTFGILALIAAGVCAKAMLQDAYVITYGILFGAWAIAGIVGGRLAEPRGRHTSAAWTAGAVVGPAVLAVVMPLWGPGVPILALLAGGVLAAIGTVIAVSIKPTY